eukprot:CAMPEP_0185027768 /NCGR_PEP_ID=MMETSP1103-20130426/12976_1 /TAXON_ID=36769 /ORGANISM="Paraphysomonas bandaiensis, Strain Caron Lab Isolate" /LENGTH=732 /DNA_ID=CAMNT_0027561887 /DNA_START=194 /DNA_END=2392 /DNA_ORIENTATION=-
MVIDKGDGAVAVLPYGVKCVDDGVQVSYGPTRRSVTDKWIRDTFDVDLQLSSVQPYSNRKVISHDDLSVTMQYEVVGGSFHTPLVKGSPFITVVYEESTPVVSSTTMHITNVESRVVENSLGMHYIVTLGNYQKWYVYCSEPKPLVWSGDTLTAVSAFSGVIRVAILPLQNVEAALSQLLLYTDSYPIGADVDMRYSDDSKATLTYTFKTEGSGLLLMLALPHHVDVMTEKVSESTMRARDAYSPIWSIKGKMLAIEGNVWHLHYKLLSPGWVYDLKDRVISTDQLNSIGQALQLDVLTLPPVAPDPYNFGKEVARLATLALIADNLGITDARKRALNTIENSLTPWVLGKNNDALVYDSTWGGVVPSAGIADKMADYGAGWYNDHHFHYGYIIHTAAALAKLDRPYFDLHRAVFDALLRDVCNKNRDDSMYPYVRHKDMFDGHSWASGLFQQANGKSQESSSEAVNAYYAVKLYADATEDTELSKFADLMLSMEVHSVKKYWHVSNFDIYDEAIGNIRMIGNVGAFDVTTSTWFGSKVEFIHGINIIPLSPVTEHLYNKDYVGLEWSVVEPSVPHDSSPFTMAKECSKNDHCVALGITGDCCPTSDSVVLACCDGAPGVESEARMNGEWAALLYAVHAVIDPDSAWNEMMSVKNYGSGNSRANSLFWVASRPTVQPASMHNYSTTTRWNQSFSFSASCSENSACDAAGMIGKCCPSDSGINLGCCPIEVAG